jgi:hypothetical protein
MKLPLQPQVQSASPTIAERTEQRVGDTGGGALAELVDGSSRMVAQRQLADLAAGSQRMVAQRQLAAIANGVPLARQLPPQTAPATGGGTIQRMLLVEGKDKSLAPAPKPPSDKSIDSTKLTVQERALLRVRIAAQKDSMALLAEFDREHPEAPSGGAPKADSAEGVKALDYAEVNAIGEVLTAREKMPSTDARKTLDEASDRLEQRINAAYLRLAALSVPEIQSTCRDYLAVYVERLRKLKPDTKAGKADAGAGGAFAHVITDQDRANYRADIREDGVWGGLAEADVVAKNLNRQFHIFRIDHNQTYRRVTTVGRGNMAIANLLHLGSHYVALRTTATEAAPADNAHRIETTADGNCLYESLLCAFYGRNVSAAQRRNWIRRSRNFASNNMSVAAVDTSIVGLLSQGTVTGVGSKMHKMMAGEAQRSRVKALTEGELTKLDERFKGLETGDLSNYKIKRAAYLSARRAGADTKETGKALNELDVLIGAGEAFLSRKAWAEKPKDISLSLGWWQAVQLALGDKVSSDVGKPFIALANLAGLYNTQAAEPVPPFKTMLPLLDEMELSAKGLEPPQGDEEDAATREARIAMFRFQTVELRAARSKLVRLYQFGEGSAHRSGPGNRPELHYDSYAEGDKDNLVTPDLPLAGKEQALLDKFVKKPDAADAKGKGAVKAKAKEKVPEKVKTGPPKKPALHKVKQEGLTAIALARKYPDKFGKISAAPHPEGSKVNVEYYDTAGNPWDQVAPLSFAKGGSPDQMALSVIDHLKSKKFAHRDTGVEQDSGVILDCTYIDEYDYTRMWAILIARVAAADLRDRVVEINVPFVESARKPAVRGKKSTPQSALDACRSNKESESFEIYPLQIASVVKVIPSIIEDRTTILAGNHIRPNKESPVYRNHNNLLPNKDSYFLEYYPGNNGGKSNAAEWRLVWDKTTKRLFITPSHYRPWVSPYSNTLRHPFYEIVG